MRDWLFNIKDYTKKIFKKIYEFITYKLFGVYNGEHLIFPFFALIAKVALIVYSVYLFIIKPILLFIAFGIRIETFELIAERITNFQAIIIVLINEKGELIKKWYFLVLLRR